MRWDFFYDESKGKAYESLQQWYSDIHYVLLTILAVFGILVILGIAFVFFF